MKEHYKFTSSTLNQQKTNIEKAKIEGEIISLRRQLEQLNIDADGVDFSMKQTYKEMIQSRQEALSQLPASR
ncbi:hypothetical protein [Marinibactrum halimedae]|uniref:Uncharacterized protein n=1 Tax=Marinibactrum halimedae TaxID=1444977 RepID=A0AA37WN34_9GAMM|nr:hypothetical protein [Marinibactrum halimedae]MCD9460459.1 hypothetical protein [Marinibactrum halimedae]GLS25866.1 hypothetical protein GCM10007877_15800 [Marinibactrum halimedae]